MWSGSGTGATGERTAELDEFLIGPIRALGLSALIHGVRYPAEALVALSAAGIAFGGYLPNYRVPAAFAETRLTLHVPRRPYVRMLPGIPTIRVFEALACGIPLLSAPWSDAEGLFSPGQDYLVAEDGAAMRRNMRLILNEADVGRALAEHGLRTIQARHSCAHRVDELLSISRQLGRELVPQQLTEV